MLDPTWDLIVHETIQACLDALTENTRAGNPLPGTFPESLTVWVFAE